MTLTLLTDLWDDSFASTLDEPELLRYRSNLLGSDPRLTNFGGQRMMNSDEFGFTDPKYLENFGSRAEEIAGWKDLGVAEIVVAVPGLQNTDDTIYEAIEDIRTAGIECPTRSAAVPA